jgi:uncharacterized membrane protein YphA (DoxX/SURF4 family)
MNRLGFFSILAIIALRLCIGWHFFKEGAEKLQSGKFTASGFLGGAVGPFEDHYHQMVWDRDGKLRLNSGDMVSTWDRQFDDAAKFYRFTAEQIAGKKMVIEVHKAQLEGVLKQHKNDLQEFERGRERVASLSNDPTRDNVASLRGQRDTITGEWRRKGAKALKEIDQVWENYENAIHAIATWQQKGRGLYRFKKPKTGFIDTNLIDRVIPYFDVTVGVCLILGLFTRIAAVAGGLFLVSVVLSQFPGWPGAQPTYYQAIEAISMFVLAAVGAGLYGGLDFIIKGFWQRRGNKLAKSEKS